MPINWKTVTAISAGTVVVGSVLYTKYIHRDLYKSFPEVDHKTLRKAFNRALKNAVKGKYEPDLSEPELNMLILDQVYEIKQST